MKQYFLILKGIAMGMAEAIPGVSGGTIAFITGIYEELLSTIKSITPGNLRLMLSDRRKGWHMLNGPFLLYLLMGMAFGLLAGVFILGNLLETDKELLWAFFFGIVLASSIYFALRQSWSASTLALCLGGTVLAFGITMISPSSGSSESLMYIFFAGLIAVSALMLPGLSGSFILLLLGLYETIILALKDLIGHLEAGRNILVLSAFAAGAFVGLFSFARVLSYLFRRFHDHTMAFMIGILLGSLNKLWPWKLIVSVFNKETGEIEAMSSSHLPQGDMYKIISEQNVSASVYADFAEPRVVAIVLSFLAGAALIGLLSRLQKPVD